MTEEELKEWFTPREDCNRVLEVRLDPEAKDHKGPWSATVTEWSNGGIVHQDFSYGFDIHEATVNAINEWSRTRCGAI